MFAIIAGRAGGPEVLQYAEVPDPVAGPGEVIARVSAAGVNFIDTYRRSGVYPMPFPHVVGSEGAGEIIGIGEGVNDLVIGDRVAWMDAPGSYAEQVVVPAARALLVPPEMSLDVAAAVTLQGLTAHYLVNSTYQVQPGDPVLIHAGAGGVGLLLTQWATARGGAVISTVSTAEKAELSKAAGAIEVIRYDQLTDLTAELPALVRQATGGGVAVVYDGVGRTTFDASLASLRPRGTLVLFGGSSGQVPGFDLQRLSAAGSLWVTRPTLRDYSATTEELRWRAGELFGAVSAGRLAVRIGARFGLDQAGEAQRRLQSRATTGKVILDIG
jgi:NADPH:quinone reductase